MVQVTSAETETECVARLGAQHAGVAELNRQADQLKMKVRADRLKMDTSIAGIEPSPVSQAHLDSLNTQDAIKEAAEDAADRDDNLAYERKYEAERANCSNRNKH